MATVRVAHTGGHGAPLSNVGCKAGHSLSGMLKPSSFCFVFKLSEHTAPGEMHGNC